MPELSRLEFLEKFLGKQNLVYQMQKTTRVGITDLHLLKTLLAIHQKSREPRFWEVIDSFLLLACTRLAATRNLLQ